MKGANCGQAAACTVPRQFVRLSYKKINYAVSAGRLPARSTHPSYFVQSKCIRNRKSLSKFSETDKLFSISFLLHTIIALLVIPVALEDIRNSLAYFLNGFNAFG